MKNPSDKARYELTQMLADCSDGWLEAVDTALVRGYSFGVVLKATQHWLAGAYERADLLLRVALNPDPIGGEDVDYTIITDRNALESVIRSLNEADVIAIDTETYAPAEVRSDVERAESHFRQLTVEFEGIREAVKRAKTNAEERPIRAVRDAIKDQLKAAKAKLKIATGWLKQAGLDPHQAKIRLIQLAVENRPVVMVDLDTFDDVRDLEPLCRILLNDSVKVFHNANFDIKMLWAIGFDVSGPIFDTMLAARLLSSSGRVGLANIAKRYLNVHLSKTEQTSDWNSTLTDSQLLYAARDALVLLRLRTRLKSELVEANLTQIAKIEFNCVRATAEMEYTGMKLHSTKVDAYYHRVETRRTELRAALYDYLGEINLVSPHQVKRALTHIGVDVESTARRALIPLIDRHPSIPLLLEYKKLSTLVSVFFEPLPRATSVKTGRIHANYWQLGAVTGRFSCSGPNFQQVPRDAGVRACFVAEDGNKLVIADYSQIELRIAAEISEDQRMTEAYRNDADLHRLTASLVQGVSLDEVTTAQRQAAKAINFGLIFGMGPRGLKYSAKHSYDVEMSLDEAKTFRNRFFEVYSGIRAWHRKSEQELKYTNKQRTLCGRRFVWKGTPSFTVFINRQVQGTAADIAKIALGELPSALQKSEAKIIAMIHDEIIIEVPEANADEAARILQQTMEAAGREILKQVPIVAEARIADSWAENKRSL